MLNRPKIKIKLLCPASVLSLFIFLNIAAAQVYHLTLDVAEVNAHPGEQIEIPVYMMNLFDTVAAFEMWFMLEKPNMIHFDSPLSVETSGTLCENWDISIQSFSDFEIDLKVTGAAAEDEQGIPPQYGQIPLIKLLAGVYPQPDTLDSNTVRIFIQAENLDHFSFTDPDGDLIGVLPDTVYEEQCFHCNNWSGEECLDWMLVDCDNYQGSIDSVWCCDTVYIVYLHTDIVSISGGMVTILPFICGDLNIDDTVNILDVIHYITCLYGMPDPGMCDFSRMDIDCDGETNILDIVYYIAYLYQNGPPVECCP